MHKFKLLSLCICTKVNRFTDGFIDIMLLLCYKLIKQKQAKLDSFFFLGSLVKRLMKKGD